jgi:hypothetical protein
VKIGEEDINPLIQRNRSSRSQRVPANNPKRCENIEFTRIALVSSEAMGDGLSVAKNRADSNPHGR